MRKNGDFFLTGDATDMGYVHVRDSEHWKPARDFTESLWRIYRPYADRHSREDAMHQFLQRFWEMYVACALIDHGFKLERVGDEGPEFYFLCDGRRIWVEAIAPGPGDGPDRVPESRPGQAFSVPEEKILMRYTHALREKHRQYESALAKGFVQPDDQILLAINCRGIPHAPYGAEIPYILKAFLPLGALTLALDRETMEVKDSFHQRREAVVKEVGSPVATTSFLDPKFSTFCAVLHSSVDCANHPLRLGDDFLVLHNPMALPPLSTNLFSWYRQFEFQDETLQEIPPVGRPIPFALESNG